MTPPTSRVASLLGLLLSFWFAVSPASGTLAFPGAEGFGAHAVGGRGGTVLFVTNLNDAGRGSLRAAVETEGPRTVIFQVSGTIALKSTLAIRAPYITIAGQTAPGDGICLKDRGLAIAADHVIVRHLRCRPGDNTESEPDALSISAGQNIIVDHCSASWAVDETLSASTRGDLGNLTVQWCIISESLNASSHHKGNHGFGSLIRGGWGNGYTFHHNLYAHHRARLPRPGNYNSQTLDPNGLILDFRNNVIYNWGGDAAGYNADGSNGVDSITRMNFVGNYYQSGPDSRGTLAFSESTPTAQAYFADNAMNGHIPDDPWSLVVFRGFSDEDLARYQQAIPIPVAAVDTDDAMTAYERVLAEAGATLPARDSVDARVVASAREGTGHIIDDEDEVRGWPPLASTRAPKDADRDGMPDQWERRHGLSSTDAEDRNADDDQDGYTNLEEYLNGTQP
ncbi:MAG: hypothetical protein JSW27_09435 [Phycisphaerales bacterium]|nr:MAG: hypothetical protein JSW27_09435 [Phycisphaerales bacterium]